MRKIILIALGCSLGFAVAWAILVQHYGETLKQERARWEAERVALQAKTNEASPRPAITSIIQKKEIVRVQEELDPEEIIDRLKKIKISSGAGQTKNARLAIQQFETLISIGPRALPAIRDFLSSNAEIDYDSSLSPRGSRDGRISTEFALPPSLRFGLFDVARQIGGPDAEKLLADVLSVTGRGVEIAYLARVLQDMAPNKYRDLCINTARELLSRPIAPGAKGLDKYDREYLYGVLGLFGDPSFAAEAQAQLVRADGGVDQGALRYLQQTLGTQALPSVINAYDQAAIDPSKKEPLARYALEFAGADPMADDFWHRAISDPNMPIPQRAELIEDLNQDGIQSEEHPTAQDAQRIKNRLLLIERWRHEATDPALIAAYKEAEKDLLNMWKIYEASQTGGLATPR